jgi:hypothetical protein
MYTHFSWFVLISGTCLVLACRSDTNHITDLGRDSHTVEKCYKIHRYPPRYKSRRPPTANQVMNNASSVNNDGSVPNAMNPNGNAPNVVNPFPMSQEQCQ